MGFGVERTALGVRSDAFTDEAILLDQCEIPVRFGLSADEEPMVGLEPTTCCLQITPSALYSIVLRAVYGVLKR